MTERPQITYKVAEVAPVTEESLQAALNEVAAEGWSFESLHFVMRDGSHRPSMAYLFFTRGADLGRRAGGPGGPQAEPEAPPARSSQAPRGGG